MLAHGEETDGGEEEVNGVDHKDVKDDAAFKEEIDAVNQDIQGHWICSAEAGFKRAADKASRALPARARLGSRTQVSRMFQPSSPRVARASQAAAVQVWSSPRSWRASESIEDR